METIDQQIRRLEFQKKQEGLERAKIKNKELADFVKTLEGKYFKSKIWENSGSFSGSMTYLNPKAFKKSTTDGVDKYEIKGEALSIGVSGNVYRHTYFNEYRYYDIPTFNCGNGGDNTCKSIVQEGVMGIGVKPFGGECITSVKKKRVKNEEWGSIEYIKSKDAFEYNYTECSQEEYEKVEKVAATATNYMYQELAGICFSKEHESVNTHLLSLTSFDKADEIIEKINYIYDKIRNQIGNRNCDVIKELLNKVNITK